MKCSSISVGNDPLKAARGCLAAEGCGLTTMGLIRVSRLLHVVGETLRSYLMKISIDDSRMAGCLITEVLVRVRSVR